MSLLILNSTNPQFSHIIAKNPSTIRESGEPFKRPVRKGTAYGWFPANNDQEFRILFKEPVGVMSFVAHVDSQFEFLYKEGYVHPYLPIGIIQNCLSSAAKTQHELDTGDFRAEITFLLQVYNRGKFKRMVRFLGDKVTATELSGDIIQRVTVSAPTVYEVLNITNLLCIVQTKYDDNNYIPLKSQDVQKYVNVLNRIDAPFYLRSAITSSLISSDGMFDSLKDQINVKDIVLQYGDTRYQRWKAVSAELAGGDTLIDIGCGELFFAFRLANRYGAIIASDANEELQEINRGKLVHRELGEQISLMGTMTPQYVNENKDVFTGADILMTELVEHLSMEDFGGLLLSLLGTEFRRIVITTPNSAFNVHYGMEPGAMRHDDHKWELTTADFLSTVTLLVTEYKTRTKSEEEFTLFGLGVGDAVGNCHTSTMVVIQRGKNEPLPAA